MRIGSNANDVPPTAARQRKGTQMRGAGSAIFAAILLTVAGTLNIVYGIGAIRQRELLRRYAYVVSSLHTWGWITLIIGIVQLTAGFSLMGGRPYGRIVGIAAGDRQGRSNRCSRWAVPNPCWALGVFAICVSSSTDWSSSGSPSDHRRLSCRGAESWGCGPSTRCPRLTALERQTAPSAGLVESGPGWIANRAEGAGPFTSRVTWRLPDGGEARWESRAARKRGAISVRAREGEEATVAQASPAIARRLRRLNWVAAGAFTIGGSLFALGAVVAQLGSGDASTAATIYFIGGLFFSTGGYASLLGAINAPRKVGAGGALEVERWRWWSYEPEPNRLAGHLRAVRRDAGVRNQPGPLVPPGAQHPAGQPDDLGSGDGRVHPVPDLRPSQHGRDQSPIPSRLPPPRSRLVDRRRQPGGLDPLHDLRAGGLH